MLAINYLVDHPQEIDIRFDLLNSTCRRQIQVLEVIEKLGGIVLYGLLGAYIYTGCDQIGCFSGISKERTFLQFINSEEIAGGFRKLGDSENLMTSESLMKTLNLYTISLYLTQGVRQRLKTCQDIGELRYHLYITQQVGIN